MIYLISLWIVILLRMGLYFFNSSLSGVFFLLLVFILLRTSFLTVYFASSFAHLTVLCAVSWRPFACIMWLRRCIIALQILLFWIRFVFTWRLILLLLFLSPSLFSVPLHHLLELLMLSKLFFFLLFPISLSLEFFLLDSSSFPSFCIASLILKNGFVIYVLESGYFSDQNFSIMGYFLIEAIVLQIQDSDLWHFHQNFWQNLLSIDFIIGNI